MVFEPYIILAEHELRNWLTGHSWGVSLFEILNMERQMDRQKYQDMMRGAGQLDYEIYLKTEQLLACQKALVLSSPIENSRFIPWKKTL